MERFKGQPFTILGINSDQDPEEVRSVIEHEKMTWPNIFDGGMPYGPIARQWDIRMWPTPYLIDDTGIIRCWASMQNVKAMVDELVAKAAARARESR